MDNFGDSPEENENGKYKKSSKRATYTSYNALAGKIEIPSVSEAMHEFIFNEFDKLKGKDNIS